MSNQLVLLSSWLFLLGSSCVGVVESHDAVRSIHGSGTTNPSKCYWGVMEKLQTRAKLPLRMTYRAIGSGSGQTEFLNDVPVVNFASGDYAIANDKYTAFTANTETVQLPVFLGAVSFFHSVPDTPNLNVTACILAKIFNGQIDSWADPEIRNLNPSLTYDQPIQVTHRADKSSSTRGITAYLHAGCSAEWPATEVGSLPAWSAASTFTGVQGSGQMTSTLTSKEGAIGYLDAGHGHSAGLQEITLENAFGNFQNSKQAAANNGIAQAAVGASLFPSAATADWSEVNLMNKPGEFTWPIVAITYVYARKDLRYMDSADEQTLLVASLKALYDPAYNAECESVYKFTAVTGSMKDVALAGIDSLVVDGNATNWVFEDSTQEIVGMGDYYFSVKRRSANEVELDSLETAIQDMKNQIESLRILSANMEVQAQQLEQEMAVLEQGGPTSIVGSSSMDSLDEEDREGEITAALALSILSFCFWIIFIFAFVCRRVVFPSQPTEESG